MVVYHGSILLDLIKQYKSNDIPGQEWIMRYFQKTTLIDLLLLQKWILHVLDAELRRLPRSLGKLNQLKRDLLVGLDEYSGLMLSYDSGESMLEAGRKTLRLNRLHDAVQAKVSGLQGLIEVAESQRRSRRDYLLRLLSLLITLVFGLSGAKTLVDTITSFSPLPLSLGLFARLFNGVIEVVNTYPDTSVLTIFGLFITLSLLVVVSWSLPSSQTRKATLEFDQGHRNFRTGLTSPVKVQVHSEHVKDADDGNGDNRS